MNDDLNKISKYQFIKDSDFNNQLKELFTNKLTNNLILKFSEECKKKHLQSRVKELENKINYNTFSNIMYNLFKDTNEEDYVKLEAIFKKIFNRFKTIKCIISNEAIISNKMFMLNNNNNYNILNNKPNSNFNVQMNYSIHRDSITNNSSSNNNNNNNNIHNIISTKQEKLHYMSNITDDKEVDVYELSVAFALLMKCPFYEKMLVLFNVTDIDNDGYINEKEIKKLIFTINLIFADEKSPIIVESSIISQSLASLKANYTLDQILNYPGNLIDIIMKEKYVLFSEFMSSIKKINNYEFTILPKVNLANVLNTQKKEPEIVIDKSNLKEYLTISNEIINNKHSLGNSGGSNSSINVNNNNNAFYPSLTYFEKNFGSIPNNYILNKPLNLPYLNNNINNNASNFNEYQSHLSSKPVSKKKLNNNYNHTTTNSKANSNNQSTVNIDKLPMTKSNNKLNTKINNKSNNSLFVTAITENKNNKSNKSNRNLFNNDNNKKKHEDINKHSNNEISTLVNNLNNNQQLHQQHLNIKTIKKKKYNHLNNNIESNQDIYKIPYDKMSKYEIYPGVIKIEECGKLKKDNILNSNLNNSEMPLNNYSKNYIPISCIIQDLMSLSNKNLSDYDVYINEICNKKGNVKDSYKYVKDKLVYGNKAGYMLLNIDNRN